MEEENFFNLIVQPNQSKERRDKFLTQFIGYYSRARLQKVIEEGLVPIKSPILGTLYVSPKPGDPAFVEVGSIVEEKDTVCIIEVMKLFTSIMAGVRGRIAKICAEDGQMVQYDQVMFLVEPEKDTVEQENN